MVKGLDYFINKFKGFEDCYTIIGGTACNVLMDETETPFRATKDIDMILIMEARHKEFANTFWEFIEEGGYKCGWRNSDEVHFYRFTEPKKGYPSMIELFSRKPDYLPDAPAEIIPIYIDDYVSSLSAILLDDDFYNFMLSGRKTVSDICVLDAEHLIPFKMYAWLDLKKKKQEGKFVPERDIKKHKYDVFRLLQIVDTGLHIETTGLIRDSIVRFLNDIKSEEIPFDQLGIPFQMSDALRHLASLYVIPEL